MRAIQSSISSSKSTKNLLLDNYINPLITASTPLLLLLVRLRDPQLEPDPLLLRNQILQEINAFEITASKLNCSHRYILAARYCLCAAIDEAILGSTWGSNSLWAQQTLLSLVQKETWGGERFFIILEKMQDEIETSLPLLELLYILLSLGFEGKYYNQSKPVLDEIRSKLFNAIHSHYATENPNFHFKKPMPFIKKPPFFTFYKALIVAVLILTPIFIALNVKLEISANPLLKQLNQISSVLTHQTVNSYE